MFSLVLFPAPNSDLTAVQAVIVSVRQQLYPYWELWVPEAIYPVDRDADARLRIIPDSTSTASDHAELFNAASAVAEGEFVVPLPSDATLAESALYEAAVAIGEHSETDLLYSDEDRLDVTGERCSPHFKTGWDPDLSLGRDAIGLLVAYRTTLLNRLGGMRPSHSNLALGLYDLSLRVAFATSPARINHVPAVLCHRRTASNASAAWDAEGGRDVVRRLLAERGIPARVLPSPVAPSWNRLVHAVREPAPLVSVIVPTRDRAELLKRCADAVLTRTDYPAIELVIVDNDSREAPAITLLQHLAQDSRVRVLSCPGPFHYAALNNLAARQARGDILLLLNNDTDCLHSDWLREMVSHATRPDVGAVGAKLLYADGRVQHAGIVLGPGLAVTHQLRFANHLDTGPAGELALTRTVSAVTGACLAVRRSVFFEVGGFNEKFMVEFNDIDLCLRISDHGYRIVWTPFAELLHLESVSRGHDTTPAKQALAHQEFCCFHRFWSSLRDKDPFHNPNLIYGWDNLLLASPPRHRRPWSE